MIYKRKNLHKRHWRFWVIFLMIGCGGTLMIVAPVEKRRLYAEHTRFFAEHGTPAQGVDTVLSARNASTKPKHRSRRYYIEMEYERRYTAAGVEIRQIRKSTSADRAVSVLASFEITHILFYDEQPKVGLNNGFPYGAGAADYPAGATFTFTLSYDPDNPARNSADVPMPFYIRSGFYIGLMLVLLSPLFLDTANLQYRRRRRW